MNAVHANELAQIQSLVVFGNRQPHCRSLVLQLAGGEAGRAWLAQVLASGWLTPADQPFAAHGVQMALGLTRHALELLSMPAGASEVLRRLAPAFHEGARDRAAGFLADTGPSAAALWDEGFAPQDAHVLIVLHAASAQALAARTAELLSLVEDAVSQVHCQDAAQLTVPVGDSLRHTVHFGYLDGITRVGIEGIERPAPGFAAPKSTTPPAAQAKTHARGEFLLGHANNDGFNRWVLAAEDEAHPGVARFFRNASFGALRLMAQDEAGFRAFLASAAQASGLPRATVAAKLLGRWADGQVIAAGASSAPGGPVPSDLDDFDFTADPAGHGCPFGSHIRRMNPRKDPVVPFRRRPLIRRGMPYGPRFEDAPHDTDRGLLGVFFCASLEDQFEFLLSRWADANPLGVPNGGNAKDPLIGQHEGASRFEIPRPSASGGPLYVEGLRAFTRTRGTLYALFPSLHALGVIASGAR